MVFYLVCCDSVNLLINRTRAVTNIIGTVALSLLVYNQIESINQSINKKTFTR